MNTCLLRARLSCAVAACLAMFAAAAPASGQAADSTFPVRGIDRPTTLPRGAIRIDAFQQVSRMPGSPTQTTSILGAGLGVTKTVEVGGQLLPLETAPNAGLTSPSLYLAWAPVQGTFTLEPMIQAVLPVRRGEALTLDASTAASLLVGGWGSLAFAPTFSVTLDSGAPGTTLTLPLSLAAQASERVALVAASGVALSRVSPRFGLSRRTDPLDWNDLTVPATATLIYTLAHGTPRRAMADLSAQVQWPQLWTRSPAANRWNPDDWTLQLQLSAYRIRPPRGR